MDCLDAMREFPDKFFSLAVIDPPYGIGEDGRKSKSRMVASAKWKNPCNTKHASKCWDDKPPEQSYFSELFRISKHQIIWGANHFISKIPLDSSCWLVWKKNGQNENSDFADCELAWTNFKTAVRFFDFAWTGFGAKNAGEEKIHPTQKPIALYLWLLQNYAHRGDKILDTHVGSASSLIACHRMGFEAWGFELDAEYHKAASERLEKEKSMQPLFAPEEIYKPQQQGLDFEDKE
jgi:site-specific DNA-methyltransferase (adenine-specific)